MDSMMNLFVVPCLVENMIMSLKYFCTLSTIVPVKNDDVDVVDDDIADDIADDVADEAVNTDALS